VKKEDAYQTDGDKSVKHPITVEYLSGQVIAQKILLHVLMGHRVIKNQQHAYELRSALMGSFRAIRRDEIMTEDKKDGYITILEEALTAIEFMRSSAAGE